MYVGPEFTSKERKAGRSSWPRTSLRIICRASTESRIIDGIVRDEEHTQSLCTGKDWIGTRNIIKILSLKPVPP